MTAILKPMMLQLLKEALARAQLDTQAVEHLGNNEYRLQLPKDTVLEALASEFVATGLEESDEPNSRGLQLEEVINRINSAIDVP